MRRAFAVTAAAAMLVAGCASSGPPVSGDRRNVGGVTVTFTVEPAVVKVGEAVRFTLRLVNNAGTEETLGFSSSQRYDFVVSDGDDEVWRWSGDQFFTQSLGTESLGGQTGLTYSESWTPDVAGTFIATGQVLAEGYGEPMSGGLEVR